MMELGKEKNKEGEVLNGEQPKDATPDFNTFMMYQNGPVFQLQREFQLRCL